MSGPSSPPLVGSSGRLNASRTGRGYPEFGPLHRHLIEALTGTGELTSAWSEAFTAVPRHRFIPDEIWVNDNAGLVPLRRAKNPQEWIRRAYGPAAVITQVDDGCPAGPGRRGRNITSSASQPNVVARMLAALDAHPGIKVPGCSVITVPDTSAKLTGTLWFVDPDTDSWANLHYQPKPNTRTYPVHQSGPRNLWDEIENAYHWWLDAGRPGPERWLIMITPQGQQVTPHPDHHPAHLGRWSAGSGPDTSGRNR